MSLAAARRGLCSLRFAFALDQGGPTARMPLVLYRKKYGLQPSTDEGLSKEIELARPTYKPDPEAMPAQLRRGPKMMALLSRGGLLSAPQDRRDDDASQAE